MNARQLAVIWVGLVNGVFCALPETAEAVQVFSGGMSTPLTISEAPGGFGSLGGHFLAVDSTAQKVWDVAPGGGFPSTFANLGSFGATVAPTGGVFLPGSGWGNESGKFLVVGGNSSNPPPAPGLGPPGDMFTVASDGTAQYLTMLSGLDSGAPFMISPRVARIVPAGFGNGTYAGQLSITDFQGGFHLLQPSVAAGGDLGFVSTLLYDHNQPGIAGGALDINPVGSAFAPAGFGTVGGTVLLSDALSGEIISLHDDGTVAHFATVPLLPGQVGLRNIEFGPPDFLWDQLGISGTTLFVSVAVPTTAPDPRLVLGHVLGGGLCRFLDRLQTSRPKPTADVRHDRRAFHLSVYRRRCALGIRAARFPHRVGYRPVVTP